MAVPAGALLEVRIEYEVNNQKCMNVLHYRSLAPLADPVTPQDVQLAVLNDYGGMANGEFPGEFVKVFCGDVRLKRLVTQYVWPTRWRASFLDFDEPGLVAGATTAQNVQWTATKYGEEAKRSDIGSIHVGGMGSGTYSQGEITPAFKAVAEVLIEFLGTDLILTDPVATLVPSIANKEPIAGSDPVRYKYVGGSTIKLWTVRDTLRTQRTRTKGVGK